MVITPDIRQRFSTAFRKARTEKLRAVRLEPDLWYCARRAPNHGKYLVHFHVIPSVSGDEQVTVECHDLDGYQCKGTFRDKNGDERLCIHAAAVISRGIQYGRANIRKEAA